jgi:hypothetical protein
MDTNIYGVHTNVYVNDTNVVSSTQMLCQMADKYATLTTDTITDSFMSIDVDGYVSFGPISKINFGIQ